jgi:hypothetical protein
MTPQVGPCTNRLAANRTQGERDATQPPARTELDGTNPW